MIGFISISVLFYNLIIALLLNIPFFLSTVLPQIGTMGIQIGLEGTCPPELHLQTIRLFSSLQRAGNVCLGKFLSSLPMNNEILGRFSIMVRGTNRVSSSR